jgi:hypothetical protein
MRKFKGTEAAEAQGGNEKIRLILMGVGLMVLLIAYFATQAQQGDASPGDQYAPTGEGQLAMPSLLPGTLDAFLDGTEEQRVALEREPLMVTLDHVGRLTSQHLEALAAPPIDPAIDALTSDPAAHRGGYYSARGEVLALHPAGTTPSDPWRAALRTEAGNLVHVIAPRMADKDLVVGDWARLDGLFAKRFTDEVEGDWLEGPLLIGPRIRRSFADFGAVTSIPPDVWAEAGDDTLDSVGDDPEELRWRALAWMRDGANGDGTWPAETWDGAPELDAATMESILLQPDQHRGKAYRVPVGLMLHLTNKRAGENPARLESYTEGWLYNTNWSERSPLLVFLAPEDQRQGLERGQRASVDIVFLRNQSYVTGNNVGRVVPLFAAARFGPFEEPVQEGLMQLIAGFLSVISLLACTMIVLWRRDQKRAAALRQKLVERRRERRARTADTTA